MPSGALGHERRRLPVSLNLPLFPLRDGLLFPLRRIRVSLRSRPRRARVHVEGPCTPAHAFLLLLFSFHHHCRAGGLRMYFFEDQYGRPSIASSHHHSPFVTVSFSPSSSTITAQQSHASRNVSNSLSSGTAKQCRRADGAILSGTRRAMNDDKRAGQQPRRRGKARCII